jgi:hypothetical protein
MTFFFLLVLVILYFVHYAVMYIYMHTPHSQFPDIIFLNLKLDSFFKIGFTRGFFAI